MKHLAYGGNILNRLERERADPAWLDREIESGGGLVALFAADKALIRLGGNGGGNGGSDDGGGHIDWRALSGCRGLIEEPLILLGRSGDGPVRFAARLKADAGEPSHDAVRAIDLRSIAIQGLVDGAELAMLAQGASLLSWHHSHRFCGTCGRESRPVNGGARRLCGACGREHFARLDPVVIAVVSCGDHCLLGRQAHFAPGVYSALAGFMEPGESIADAVAREVMEEAGVTVTDVRYHADQPWPFAASLMIGCLAQSPRMDLVIDHEELEDARWFEKRELAAMLAHSHEDGLITPPRIAIAHHLIEAVVKG